MTGNEAIARGAFEAGVKIATAYPGTPSTEILEFLARDYKEIDSSWSPNEKVAYEVAYGAALAGVRSLVCMKHVGVNVAADPLFTSVLTGTNRGLVIVSADDPGMHSSQNEQDNRNYSKFAKVPTLEPSNPEEARLFTRMAFNLSEQFDTPVMIRMTTRICHTDGVVYLEEPENVNYDAGFVKNPAKYVMVPGFARGRHKVVHQRLPHMKEYSNNFSEHKIIMREDTGIITSGVEFNYANEAFPNYSILKISMIYPLPDKIIKEFASKMKKLYVVESLDPYLEEHIKALGIDCEGKQYLPATGELSTELVRSRLGKDTIKEDSTPPIPIPARPPALCKGCPHSKVFTLLSELDAIVTGDIGCYTLGALKPYDSLDTCVCMGASVGTASGFEKVKKIMKTNQKTFAVIGDSTFIHSGITSLLEAVYNQSPITLVILDNFTTAMTGHQVNPGTGVKLNGDTTRRLDFVELAKALGVEDVHRINIFKKEDHKSTFEKALNYPGVSVIVVASPCVLDKLSKEIARQESEIQKTS